MEASGALLELKAHIIPAAATCLQVNVHVILHVSSVKITSPKSIHFLIL